ncbi:MAG: EamA family transporter [Chloroflexi bacterium]|nr:EamA family transporter [Chloroflexota bacterium]
MTQGDLAATTGHAKLAVPVPPSLGLALGQALLAVFFWSSSYALIKLWLSDVPPWTFSWIRNAFATAALIAMTRFVLQRGKPLGVRRLPWGVLILVGLGQTAGTAGTYVGLSVLPVATMAFFMNVLPLFVALLGILFLREVPTWLQGIGIAIVIGGAYIFFPTRPEPDVLAGAVWVAGGQVGWAGSTVIARRLLSRGQINSDVMSSAVMLTTVPMLGTGAILMEGLPPISGGDLLVTAVMGVCAIGLGHLFWLRALRRLPAFQASVISNMQPIFSGVQAFLIVHEPLPLHKIAGMITVLVGVLIVQWHRAPARARPAQAQEVAQ